MKLKALASGSNGNCIYIKGGSTELLVDGGISCKRIAEGLQSAGTAPENIKGVLLTHEHTDHINGLFVFLKHYKVPVYGTLLTLEALAEADLKGDIDPALFRPVEKEVPFSLGEITVTPCHTNHDAADPVFYSFSEGGKKLAVMTDTGICDERMRRELTGLSGILLESNHDIRMLETGGYPYPLKRRILSDKGHLSNDQAAEILKEIMNPELKFVLLGHISEENNYPDIALLTAAGAIGNENTGLPVIDAATRYQSSEMYEV